MHQALVGHASSEGGGDQAGGSNNANSDGNLLLEEEDDDVSEQQGNTSDGNLLSDDSSGKVPAEAESSSSSSCAESFFYEERCWRAFQQHTKRDLNPDSRKKLKQVMQGWCTCLFQTCFTVVIAALFIESRAKFADDFFMTQRFAALEPELESAVRDPDTFFDYVHAMEQSLLRTEYTPIGNDSCAQWVDDLCHWGTNNGKNDSLVDSIIAHGCWNPAEGVGYVDASNRLLFATHVTQRRRTQVSCTPEANKVDPYPASRDCLSESQEDTQYVVTEGPCLSTNAVEGSLDDCFRFGAWTYNSLADGYVVTFSEPTYGFPGYSQCRMREIERLRWHDRRTKELCYLFHVLNKDSGKILRFSNCFQFGTGGNVHQTKIISIVNVVSDEYYRYAYVVCIVAILLCVLRATCETLFFFKEMYFGLRSRDHAMFVGSLRDLSSTQVMIGRYRCRWWFEGWMIWLSSTLFIVYFVKHMGFLSTMNKVHLLPAGVYVLNAHEAFNWGVYFSLFDELSQIASAAEVNAGIALVAFMVNTVGLLLALNFHPRLGVVSYILGSALADLVAFVIVIAIFLLMGALAGYAVFGRAWEDFSTYPAALQTVASAAVGEYEQLLYGLDPIVPPFMLDLFYVYIWLIRLVATILLLNILISVFAKAYEDKKDREGMNLVRLFTSCVVAVYYWLFSCCCAAQTSRAMFNTAISGNTRKRRESISRDVLNSVSSKTGRLSAMRNNFPSPSGGSTRGGSMVRRQSGGDGQHSWHTYSTTTANAAANSNSPSYPTASAARLVMMSPNARRSATEGGGSSSSSSIRFTDDDGGGGAGSGGRGARRSNPQRVGGGRRSTFSANSSNTIGEEEEQEGNAAAATGDLTMV